MSELFAVLLLICSYTIELAVDRTYTTRLPQSRRNVTANQASGRWRPGNFQGLVVGKATYTDMLRVLAKPKQKEIFDDPRGHANEIWYTYDALGRIKGEFTVVVDPRSNQIISVIVYPESLSKETAIQHFGSDYIVTRYEFCPGSEENEVAPLFESQKGNAIFVEYRSRGIALFVNNSGNVNEINYVSKPIGLRSKRECQQAGPKYRLRKAEKSRENQRVNK